MSPRTTIQFQELREEKRTFIMNAALEHFAKIGYHNTTIRHLAKHAEISTGLLYNYFESKEELLNSIVIRSLEEISDVFDQDKDGFLSEHEFELFVRKFFKVLREKKSFWQLFFQMLMQKEVRDRVFTYFVYPTVPEDRKYPESRILFPIEINKMMIEYFRGKKDRKPQPYDYILDMKMFLYTIEGFAITSVFVDKAEDEYYDRTIDRIIEQFR